MGMNIQAVQRMNQRQADKRSLVDQKMTEVKQDIGYDRLVKMGLGKRADVQLGAYRKNLQKQTYSAIERNSLPAPRSTSRRVMRAPARERTSRDFFNLRIDPILQDANTKELQTRQREAMREKGQEQYKMQSRARRSSRGARSLMQQGQPTQGALGSAGTLG